MSFSAEMKDFLGAWEKGTKILGAQTDEEYKKAQTALTKKKTEVDYDPARLATQDEQARANVEKTRVGTALVGEQVKNAPVSRGYTAALTERIRKADQDIGGYQGTGNLPPGMGPAVGGAPVQAPAIAPREDLYGYAEGGAIPDNDADEAGGPADGDADDALMSAGPAVGGATDFSARRKGGGASGLPQAGYQGVISPQLVSDAVRGGYQYGIKSMGLGGRGTGARSKQQAQALAQGQDALSPEEMDAARKAVDPEGRLTDSQRNMAALGSVYQYWANKGDPGRADKVAFQMLQHFRLASQRYAAIAAAAAEHGNMDMATKAALKAYSNVPDGRDMNLSLTGDGKLQYNYTDENGKTISKGVASPQEFVQAAMGLTKGGFDQSILSAAAAREGGGKGAAKGAATQQGNQKSAGAAVGGDKVSDMATRDDKILDPELTKLQEAWQKKNKGKEIDEAYWGNLKDNATHVMQANPNMTAREALAVTQSLRDHNNDKFKTSEPDAQGISTIQFADGQRVRMTEEALDRMVNDRAVARRSADEADAKAKKQAEEDAKPGRFRQGLERAGAAIGRDFEKFKGEVSGMIPDEMKARVGSAVDSVKRFDQDAGRVLTDPNINMGTLTTAIKKGVQSAVETLQRGTANPGAIPETPDSPL